MIVIEIVIEIEIETEIETETEIEIGIVTVTEVGMKDDQARHQDRHQDRHQVHLEWDRHQERLLRTLFRKDLPWIKDHSWDLEINQFHQAVYLSDPEILEDVCSVLRISG